MGKLIKYGAIFAGGVVIGIAAVIGGVAIAAKKCNCKGLDYDDDDDIDDFDEDEVEIAKDEVADKNFAEYEVR